MAPVEPYRSTEAFFPLPENAENHILLDDRTIKKTCAQLTSEIMAAKTIRPSIYTGIAGWALMLQHFVDTGLYESEKEAENALKQGLRCASSAAESLRDRPDRVVTFLEGRLGAMAVETAIEFDLGRQQPREVQTRVDAMRHLVVQALRLPESDCDLLYGRAGTLFSVAYLRRRLRNPSLFSPEAAALVRQILDEGLRKGAQIGTSFAWEWHQKFYWGAAHGFAGILSVLLLFPSEVDLAAREMRLLDVWNLLADALGYLLSDAEGGSGGALLRSGNMKSSSSSTQDRLVQWCHGAPGWIWPLCLWVLQSRPSPWKGQRRKEHLILHALGEAVWARGLLKKGVGLCHGIAGNGYALLALYRLTKDTLWLRRANAFARFALAHLDELREVPDRPHSLFEGMAGLACFLASLRKPDSATMPGWILD